ncbi:hypothetical protein AB6E88_07945 [Providencia hangzhouensis]
MITNSALWKGLDAITTSYWFSAGCAIWLVDGPPGVNRLLGIKNGYRAVSIRVTAENIKHDIAEFFARFPFSTDFRAD